MDGRFVKRMFKRIEINAEGLELGWIEDLIQGMDHFRFDGYLKNV
jgi:hypothetical protein